MMNEIRTMIRAIQESPLQKLKYGIVLFLTFLIPFYFFPFFQNLVQINIVYVLAFGALLLVIISFLQLFISKKFVFQSGSLDIPVIVFLSAIFLSFITTSTNKMQALLDPYLGLMMIAALSILYFYGKQYAKNNLFSSILSLSGFIISSIIILLSLEPTKGIGIIPLDLLIFIGFIFMYSLGSLVRSFSTEEETPKVVQICTLIIVFIALVISFVAFSKQGALFPSFSLSFKALSQIFKNPLTALLGSGIDNYSSVFNRVKDLGYNQTDLWQFASPTADRSALFHIATTAGMVGLISFLYLLFSLIKKTKKDLSLMLGLICLLCVLVIFPPSFLTFFLLIFLASQTEKNNNKEYALNLSKSFSLYSYLILITTACILFGTAIRYLSTMSLANYFYTQSFTGVKENKLNKVYDSQQKALSYNLYLEQYHIDFSKTHLMVATNIMDKAASGSANANTSPTTTKPLVLTKENKQSLIEAFQIAISENQIAISLNPKKAEYWANLAQIYTMIPKELQTPNDKINTPQAAAMTYFKKAISLDANNPVYYFQIGQLSLAQQKMDDGFKYIEKAIAIKPNWADAHYQLAMLYAQKKDMKNTIKELETTLANLDPKINQTEYDAVKKVLDQINNPQPNNQTSPQQAPISSPVQLKK